MKRLNEVKMKKTQRQTPPEKKIAVLIMLPAEYKKKLQLLADIEHRTAKAQAELIVMRELDAPTAIAEPA